MDSIEPKKLLILRILDILTEYTDSEHKLKQVDIIKYLKLLYGIECERKAVSRNIEFLEYAGYDIENDRTGVYLATRKYEKGELRLLIDSVLCNRNICKSHSKDLVNKLVSEGGKHFKNYTKYVISLDDWQKTKSQDYFYNIELLADAIEGKVKITFEYCSYGLDKKLHKRKDKIYTVSPYQMLIKNGFYYLMCNYDNHDNIAYLRIDRMINIAITNFRILPLNEIAGYKRELSLGKISNRLPYMFDDKPELIELEIGIDLIDMIIDWFGYDFTITDLGNERVKITLTASPRAMRFWILQFGSFVKLLAPAHLVETIKNDINKMSKNYNLGEFHDANK